MSLQSQSEPDIGDSISKYRRERLSELVNVPNALCAIRLIGSFVLIAFAISGETISFVWLFVFLAFTDWIDGKLAILLRQKTIFGARFDSFADATLYLSLMIGLWFLKYEFLMEHIWWIICAVISYVVTTTTGFIKFGRVPSYHTWSAKLCNYLILLAVICLFYEWRVWMVYVAVIGVMLANLEATMISLSLSEWRANVASIFHVWLRSRNHLREEEAQSSNA